LDISLVVEGHLAMEEVMMGMWVDPQEEDHLLEDPKMLGKEDTPQK
jgi:hypothetical protein